MRLDKHILFGADEKHQVRYFKVFAWLPGILAIVALACGVLGGLISLIGSFAAAAQTGGMGFLIGIIGFVVCSLGGVVAAIIVFFLFRILLSYFVLQIMYSQKLLGDQMKLENVLEDVDPLTLPAPEAEQAAEKTEA